MSKLDVESLKAESDGLRGTIPDELGNGAPQFGEASIQLLKYHGVYQQDDRDARLGARDTGAGKDYSFMVRTKNPGGFLPAAFYLGMDALADRYGNGTIRVTTRGGLQLHGVRKAELKTVIAEINAYLGSTLGACGDINRNVMAPPFPYAAAAYRTARETAVALADLLTPKATAYYEIWQDDELAHSSLERAPERAAADPIYGPTFLPRKFKIAVAVPGDNSVDLYSNDLGVVPILADDGALEGYDLVVGGGLGRTNGKAATYARLASEFAFVAPGDLQDVVRAIVVVQRDHGDRTNRKHARLKYTIDDHGLEWFRAAVAAETTGALLPWRPLPQWEQPYRIGWHAQGDGRWFYGLDLPSGRIRDAAPHGSKRALRAIVEATGRDLVATPDQKLLVVDVTDAQRPVIDAILAEHGVANAPDAFALGSMACPALPTCGLALAESERVLPTLLQSLRDAWHRAGLGDGAPTVRMTGCPNGCARPYLGEIGVVGVSADRYDVYLGGDAHSTRLNAVWRGKLRGAEIAPALEPLFAQYAASRRGGESFGDFSVRALAAVPA